MSAVSASLTERRHAKAETEHLREFYMLWCQMHAVMNESDIEREKQEAAQQLIDKAKVMREFYS